MQHNDQTDASVQSKANPPVNPAAENKGTRLAFRMKLFPGKEAEYKKRHDEIWPELQALLKEAGISAYSIFLDEETLSLFGVLTITDPSNMDRLPQQEVMQRWWAYMADIMESNPDHSPVSVPLKEVFYLH
jgi:L-rhamnose mutarotase